MELEVPLEIIMTTFLNLKLLIKKLVCLLLGASAKHGQFGSAVEYPHSQFHGAMKKLSYVGRLIIITPHL